MERQMEQKMEQQMQQEWANNCNKWNKTTEEMEQQHGTKMDINNWKLKQQ